MSLEFKRNDAESKAGDLVADRRLWVNAAKTRLVEDGDPDAAFLLAGEGGRVSEADALALGLSVVNGQVVQLPLEKAAPAPENKMVPAPGGNKGADDASLQTSADGDQGATS
jgi:hypothetical protein